MPVCSTFFKILKDKKRSVLIYVLICIGLTYALTMNTKPSDLVEISKVKTMIINEDGKSTFTDGLLNYLKDYVTLVKPGKDVEAKKDALFFGEAEYILTIPKGFSDGFMKGDEVSLEKETVPNSSAALSLDNVIDNYLNMAKSNIKYTPGLNPEQLNANIKSSLSENIKTILATDTSDTVAYSNAINGLYFNFMGYAIIGTFISVISLIMLSFNRADIRKRHNASPFSYRKMNIQLILSNLVFAIGFLIVAIIIGMMLNKGCVINTNLILMWLNALIFSIAVLCASYMIGIMVNSRKAVGAISTVVSLGLSFISGIFVSQNYLGDTVLKVASISPVYWYVKANNTISADTSIQWNQVSGPLVDMAIEAGFIVLFISIALVISKRKRMQAL